MTEDIASLGLKIESSDAVKAAKSLDTFAEAAARADDAASEIGPAVSTANKALRETTTQTTGSAKNLDAFSDAAERAGEAAAEIAPAVSAANRALNETATRTTESTGNLDAFSDAATGANRAAVGMRPAVKIANDTLGETAAQGGAATRSLERLTSQLRNAAYSAAGVSRPMRGVLSVLSSMPFAVASVVGAAATLGKIFDSAQKESFGLASAIVMTGNAAGTTRGQLQLYADQIDDIAGTQAEAAAALAQFVSSAVVQADNLQDFATLAIQMQRTLGQSVGETVKLFAQLGDKPTEASAKLQRQFGFLTVEIYDQIKALEEQGRSAEAAQLAQQTFANAMRDRMEALEPQLGLIQKSWRGIKSAAKEAWDAMLDIGREQSADQLLAALEQRRGDRELFSGTLRQDADDTREVALRRQIVAQQDAAKAEAAAIATTNDYIKAQAEAEKAAREREAAQKFAAATAKRLAEAQLSFDISAIQRNLTSTLSEFSNFEDLLEAQRRAGLISEREYYAEKRTLIEQSAAAQIAALEAESKRLKADRLAGPELLEQQRKIADNEAEIAIIREKAATQVSVLSTQQKAALSDVARAYEDAQASAERYLDVLRERYRIEIEGMGQGRDARERAQGRNSLDREYTDRINDLRRDRRKASDEDQRAQIDQEIEIQEAAHQRALQDFDDYYDQLKEKQGSFYTGAMEALQNYVDESANVAAQTESAFTRAFGSMEDALTKFVMTGKLDFKSLADSIIADLIRIQMRAALSKLFSLIGGAIGGAGGGPSGSSGVGTLNSSTVGFAAKGGDISGPTIVGEEGPELIVPRNPMTVIPNHQLGGGVTINTTINAAPGMNVAQMTALLDARDAQVKADVYQNMGRNRWRRVTG